MFFTDYKKGGITAFGMKLREDHLLRMLENF